MIRPFPKDDWAGIPRVVDDRCQDVLRIVALVVRPTGKRGNPGITRRDALPFVRKQAVGGTGADNNPVIVVAVLRRKSKNSCKRRSRLQRDCIAASRIVESSLKVIVGTDLRDRS